MIKKKATRQFLENLRNQVTVLDTERFSPKYFNMSAFPDTFGSGKNLIKLSTRTNLFVPDSLIRIELLDGGGNVIYHEVLDYLGKDKSRAIAVYIYPDTVPGDGRIRLAGRLQINPDTGERYPLSNDPSSLNFVDQPNILHEGTIRIAPERKNDSEIIFTRQPRAIITEEIRTFQIPVGTGNLLTASLANASSRITVTSRVKSEDAITGNARSNQITEDQFDAAAKNIKQGIPNITSNSGTSTSGNYIVLRSAPTVAKTSGTFAFNDSMIGGTVFIANPSVASSLPSDMLNRSSYLTLPTTYSASITRVLDSSTVELSTPFVYNLSYETSTNKPSTITISKIDSSANFSASYTQKITTAATENSQSFANITLSNIEPATGDIYRVKTLYKPAGAFGDFIDLGDTVLESYNVLVDTGSYGSTIAEGIVDLPVGSIKDQNHIDTYWESTQALTYSNSNLISSIQIAHTGTSFVKLATKNPFTLIADTQYEIDFDSYVATGGIVDVYVSGSIVQPDQSDTRRLTSKPQANLQSLGTYIGTLEQAKGGRSLDNVFKFTSLTAGNAKLVFALRSGTWQFSEIKVNTLSETGFTPNYTKIKVRVPTVHLKSELIFKFQYFNYQGVRAALETVVYGVKFNGENFYIDGTNNLLTGSVYIGNSIASGIEMAGVSSGFIKSVGYTGLTSASLGKGPGGFIIYSGSGNLQVGVDILDDVGIELVSANDNSHLIFRTRNGGELDIKTDKFFIGNSGSFISGSNNNIEIRSGWPTASFHLRRTGQVTASAFYAITGSQTMLNTDIGFIDAKNVGRQLVSDNREYQVDTYTPGGSPSTLWDTGWITLVSSSAVVLPFESTLFCYFHMQSIGEPGVYVDPTTFTQYTTSSFRVNIKSASLSTYDTFESTGITSTYYTFGHSSTTTKQATPGLVSASITNYAGKLVQINVQGRHVIREPFGNVAHSTGKTKIKHIVLNTGRPILEQAVKESYPAQGNANDNLPVD
jgi:hypothetical protein